MFFFYRGTCRTCSHKLESFKVSTELFSNLAKEIRENVIIGSDVYQKTTPKELRFFLQFVEKRKPWDIVIDGLNVAYLSKLARKVAGHLVSKIYALSIFTNGRLAKKWLYQKKHAFLQVKSTVALCAETMGKKVLVLGRQHMKSWPKLDLSYIEYHADVFLAQNGSVKKIRH